MCEECDKLADVCTALADGTAGCGYGGLIVADGGLQCGEGGGGDAEGCESGYMVGGGFVYVLGDDA